MKAYTVTTPTVSFVARTPPGAEKLATVITTRQLTVKESWAPEPGATKTGAAFTRTITVEARDVPGMVLPSFAFDPPPGPCARLRDHTRGWPHWETPGWSPPPTTDDPWADLLVGSGRGRR